MVLSTKSRLSQRTANKLVKLPSIETTMVSQESSNNECGSFLKMEFPTKAEQPLETNSSPVLGPRPLPLRAMKRSPYLRSLEASNCGNSEKGFSITVKRNGILNAELRAPQKIEEYGKETQWKEF
jgi:hypothetical protein